MYLWEGVLRTRQMLNELQPALYADEEIIIELNVSAQIMCSAAQFIKGFGTFNTVSGMQEYVLPADVDQVDSVAYTSGVVFPVQIVPREVIQLGGFVGSIPFYAYLKKNTRTLTQMTNSATIVAQPINPNDQGDARTTMGLYPIPTGVLPVYVWYSAWHPQMRQPEDICQVPVIFKEGWCSYAAARMMEKISALDDAAYYEAKHEKKKQEFIDWMITNGNEQSPPQYSNRPIPPFFLRGANTLLVVSQHPGVSNL